MKDLRYDDRDDYCDGICSLVYGMDVDEVAFMIDRCHDTFGRNGDAMEVDETAKSCSP